MLFYESGVLHNQWLFLTFFGGIMLALIILLGFMTMWQPRRETVIPTSKAIPWILILLYFFTVLYAITYVIVRMFFPPNW
jgi:hypothetical protein